MLKVNGTKDMKIWNYIARMVQNSIFIVNKYDWMRYDNTGVANSPSVIDENLISNSAFGNNSLLYPDSKPYLKFAGDNSNIGMIYQYRKLASSVTVGQLIDYIVEDVKRLIR